jgi:oxygen-independent coproporphyrinogen-3 oxidase
VPIKIEQNGSEVARNEPFSLYVHIPYCRKICPYCDFNVYALKKIPQDLYIEALLQELASYKEHVLCRGRKLSTIYFGGGTPSIISEQQIARVVEAAKKAFSCETSLEITIEANPLDISEQKFSALKRLGISRVSLGAQSMRDSKLELLGRDHRAADIIERVALLRQLGFSNVNLDLIFGAPQETVADLKSDLEFYLKLNPEHISPYGLTIEHGTPFYQAQQRGVLDLPVEEDCAQMFELISETLVTAGYQHYEISNFAKPGRESQHNLACWEFKDYLGIGAGAHSSFNFYSPQLSLKSRERWANYADPKQYLSSENKLAWRESLDPQLALDEYLLLSLRTSLGLNLKKFSVLFEKEFVESRESQLKWLVAEGLIELDPSFIRLLPKGKILADSVLQELLKRDGSEKNS